MPKKPPLYPHIPKSKRVQYPSSSEGEVGSAPREILGMKIYLKLGSGEEGYARNMTEIHYGYREPLSLGQRVAFESNIHGTGFTHSVGEIIEFIATPEVEIAKEFWEPIRR
jgi:hypothetical protein